ncbi:hypothetical protein BD311DRAFT_543310 [Dichomitus squalens]|uniref:Uncharacterized protein n=1 Tax=Dichomitus squalens TaxID=114155 RepID=A0A4Q9MYL9_9APHY|nr:hypothetical protein BD311DRAFT_543310 [Dichomitus squalens]
MPGANYMGGKRNAARARVRDAEGKVQRSHFGKKRFEVLRAGLSKSGAPKTSLARELRPGPPEISLAHARRTQGGSAEGRGYAQEGNWSGLRSPLTSPEFRRRSSPAKSASGRSRILAVLDADDPAMRRAQVQKILEMPDLLGLSRTTKTRTPPCSSPQDEPRTPPRRVREQDAHDKVSSQMPAMHRSSPPTFASSPRMKQGGFRQSLRSPTGSLECIAVSSSEHPSKPFKGVDSVFVPMCLDSTPPPVADDSGYAEYWSGVEPEYEPARVPFYALLADRCLPTSPSGDSSSPSMVPLRARSSSLMSLPIFATLSRTSSPHGITRSFFMSSPSHLDLPVPLAAAQFISDMPSPDHVPEPLDPSPLPPSDISGYSWSRIATRPQNSYDISQASFSLSSNPTEPGDTEDRTFPDEGTPDVRETSCGGSIYSFLGDSQDYMSQDTPRSPNDEDRWDTICLEDVLGNLFEDADPWNELGRVLGLSLSPDEPTPDIEDTLAMLGACGRRGVGFTVSERLPIPWDLPTSQTLVGSCDDDFTNGRSSIISSTVISSPSGPEYSANYRSCGLSERSPLLYPGADPGIEETEIVSAISAEVNEECGSCSPPRRSPAASRGDSERQFLVKSTEDQYECVPNLKEQNATCCKPSEACGNLDHVTEHTGANSGSHGKQKLDGGGGGNEPEPIIDGPSLFYDEDCVCSEEE